MSDIKSMGNEHKNGASGIWIPALPILISTTVVPESADGVTYKSYKDPPDGPFCVVTSKHGDHCGGIIVRYGVINKEDEEEDEVEDDNDVDEDGEEEIVDDEDNADDDEEVEEEDEELDNEDEVEKKDGSTMKKI
ncbi:hypothetical protein BV898_14880 [Hypsibius exemplaris]|uniref:Uncharacterized protein n=1 Tax=Hypsibius exemplaris TaxID=2072580 RepID=A0A9X6RK71_HYPEX|nr:hypothetical protein BV898_14880 [Hypsibius exemplaris]